MKLRNTLNRLMQRKPSTAKEASTTIATQQKPMAEQSSSMYQSIIDLPLNCFIEVAVNGNLSALIISGFPTPDQLADAWSNINIQYADAMGNNQHRFQSTLLKEVTLLSTTYKQINTLAELLLMCCAENIYPANLFAELNILTKSNMPFTKDDPELNIKNIKRCLNRAKSIKIQLDIKSGQLEAMHLQENKENPVVKLSKEWFISILISLSNHAGYRITETITVFEFVDRLKRYNDYSEQLKKQQHGRK